MKFLELKKHLAGGELFPCYIACGDDGYLLRRTVEAFSALITVLPQFNLSIFSEANVQEITVAAQSLPMLAPLRVIIAPFCDVSDYLKNPSSTTVILLTCKEAKTLKNAEIIDCNKLEKNSLLSVIAAKTGGKITTEAADLLIEYTLRNMERIDIELKKLLAYKSDGVITAQDVRLLVSAETEYKVYELADMIFKKNPTRALTLLHEMLNEGTGAAPKVYGLLYNHFRRLMYASLASSPAAQSNLAADLGVKDYAIKMAAVDARKISQKKLKSLLDALHQLDYSYKSGLGSDRTLLENFVLLAINEVI